jgi:hypothetical protein
VPVDRHRRAQQRQVAVAVGADHDDVGSLDYLGRLTQSAARSMPKNGWYT